jgi:hypothetical protein
MAAIRERGYRALRGFAQARLQSPQARSSAGAVREPPKTAILFSSIGCRIDPFPGQS